ncbi:MAG TPA: carboxypeptidase-like regulatory domain-containing protein, partial [Thermomicrobiales bacterium]|nr:carboxypeptidase-like regulatory domain-containing protein [Thermomicrobiales bacterium]
MATLLAGVFATSITVAQTPDPSDDGTVGDIWDGTEPALLLNQGGLYFPWVGNDDESTGLGPADTSVSVMNISPDPAVVFAWVGSHDTSELPDTGSWDLVGPFFLAPWASKTFTAAQLGIAEGTGAPVAFAGYNALYSEGGSCTPALGEPLAPGNDVNNNGACNDVEVWLGGDLPYDGNEDLCVVDDAQGNRTNNYEGVLGGGGGLNNDGDCLDAEQGPSGGASFAVPTTLGGYAKQAVDGENLPMTSSADSSVSGYNALGGFELGEFDDWYFPIAQTNCGPGGCWNTILRIANFGQVVDGEVGHIGSAAVTARFFPADDAQGSLSDGFQLQALLNTGDVWEIDISDYVPEGWVGSVHVYSDSAVFAMADRVKVGYGAWITNTASNAPYTNANNVEGSASGSYVLFAPDVRFDFFGWNTGINIANLVNQDNNVNVQYFNAFGNAPQTLTRRLAAQGMTYFYDPAIGPQDGSAQDPSADVNADIIGSALIWSDYPVAVAVDATKYPETTTSDDPNIYQAMSYSATANLYVAQAFPLVQKGNPTTGMGATSGINIMNPNSNAAQATVYWVNPSGFGADNFGQSAVAIPGFANGFVYTMTQGNLPNGFYGSAVMVSTLPVAAVTTQVDYQVEWDGTAVWLGYNPCGYYRDSGAGDDFGCNFGDPFNPQGGQVTKIVVDDTGEPVTGVLFTLMNEAYYQQNVLDNDSFLGQPWVATGYSNIHGEVEWTNVPVGTYYLEVTEVPTTDDNDLADEELPQYEGAGEIEGPFTLNEGEDLTITNELARILATKIVYLGDDAEGAPVCLVAAEDGDDEFDEAEDTEAYACDTADDEGVVVFEGVEPGWYFVTVNIDLDGDDEDNTIPGFSPFVSGAELFVLGGVYVNDLSGDVNPAEGAIQKVLVLPDLPGDVEVVSISGIIGISGPGGFEVEGNVQTEIDDAIGPNGEAAYSLTVFNVPVGGPYVIDEFISITLSNDVVLTIDDEFSAQDGHAICADYLDATVDCELADGDIIVYEDMVTRVFNFVGAFGDFGVYVFNDATGDPIEGASVCAYDEGFNAVACGETDDEGNVGFELPTGTYLVSASAPGFESQAAVCEYDAIADSGPVDCTIGLEPGGSTLIVN